MPGTEIYTTWGYLGAKTPLFGAGFGVSVGYLFASWKNFKLYGDIGFNSISVKSEKMFSDIVPNGPKEKAKWNLGGIQLQIRGSFGFWNKPKPKDDDDDDDDDDDSPKKSKVKIINDTKKDSVKADTVGNIVDSTKVADSTNAVQDTVKANVNVTPDSTKKDSVENVADSVKDAVKDSAKVNSIGKATDTAKETAPDSAKTTPAPVKKEPEPESKGD